MRIFWEAVERLDRASFALLEKGERLRKKPSYRAQIEEAVEEVRPPQRAIQFDA